MVRVCTILFIERQLQLEGPEGLAASPLAGMASLQGALRVLHDGRHGGVGQPSSRSLTSFLSLRRSAGRCLQPGPLGP